ncbi:MAG: hypothetical protein PWP08_1223 [Methanofollis sp.]|nr:hypothetical protein [Methanofollis sp.]
MTPHAGEEIRVLTVDDDPAVLDTISLYLENIGGFVVCRTGSPEEALNRLESGCFDICISDYDMPGMNGIQLLERIREEDNAVPYILITGNLHDDVEARARGAGASDVLRKSSIGMKFYTDLVAAVRRAVERSRDRGAFDCRSGIRV